MAFLLMHQSIVEHDAIGHDIVQMHDILNRRHTCLLYADHTMGIDGKNVLGRGHLERFLADPGNTVIYHHSNYWPEAEQVLSTSRARIVFKYHNITPPAYFDGFDPYSEKCLEGREQTYRLRATHPDSLWLGDSRFNLVDAGLWDIPKRFVVPPFAAIAHSKNLQPEPALLKALVEEQRVHVLFIGRFAPNKGHRLLVSVLKEYVDRYGDDIVVNLIGKLDPVCQRYHDDILNYAADLGVQQHINYIGEISDSQLLAYYLGSDVYVCGSDHEGFCVPVAESQYAHLPVVVKGAAAVPETVGDGGVVLGDHPAPYADAIYRLRSDRRYRDAIVARGYRNYLLRFTHTAVETRFRCALERWLGVAI